jgi:hypothetical protein
MRGISQTAARARWWYASPCKEPRGWWRSTKEPIDKTMSKRANLRGLRSSMAVE